MKNATKFVEKQLVDLAVPRGSSVWNDTFEDAVEFADIATKEELKKFIEERIETAPYNHFLR